MVASTGLAALSPSAKVTVFDRLRVKSVPATAVPPFKSTSTLTAQLLPPVRMIEAIGTLALLFPSLALEAAAAKAKVPYERVFCCSCSYAPRSTFAVPSPSPSTLRGFPSRSVVAVTTSLLPASRAGEQPLRCRSFFAASTKSGSISLLPPPSVPKVVSQIPFGIEPCTMLWEMMGMEGVVGLLAPLSFVIPPPQKIQFCSFGLQL